MKLSRLRLFDFKNYEDSEFNFVDGLNLITGPNGSGKTNLLDAVYYLCLTQSMLSTPDSKIMRHGTEGFALRAAFSFQNGDEELFFSAQKGRRKSLTVNNLPYSKLSEHIGRFPCTAVLPYDTDLVRQSGEIRRKFFDSVLCQTDSGYLKLLIFYGKILKERNSLLKQFVERNYFDELLLGRYDDQLIETGGKIARLRADFCADFVPIFVRYYETIAEDRESAGLNYFSDGIKAGFAEIFRANRPKDRLLLRTGRGIHRDEYEFLIAGQAAGMFGSQGQQKSFVISLKLAEFDFIRQKKQLKPILLLDDIYDKLDEKRLEKLTNGITGGNFGQVFLSDARPDRLPEQAKNSTGGSKIFRLGL